MENLLIEVLKSQGIWAVIALITIFTLMKVVMLLFKQSGEREKKLMELLDGKTDKIDRRTQHIDDNVIEIKTNVATIGAKVVKG